jgi:Leucine-rich repeat (LRR) protein
MPSDIIKIRQLLLSGGDNAKVAIQLLKGDPNLKAQIEQEFAPALEALGKKRLSSLVTWISKFRSGERLHKNEKLALMAYPLFAQQLERFDLADSRLKALPEHFRYLPHLKSLNLSINKITTFPKQLLELKNLEELYINHNHLSSFPPILTQLVTLKKLYLAGNKLKTIPSEISQLIALDHLDLYNNRLHKIPNGITLLSNLKTLHLGKNHLRLLPQNIGNLSSLESLNIDSWNNHLQVIPESFAKLQKLSYLSLFSVTDIQNIEPIFECKSLTKIDLGLGQSKTISPNIGQLHQLHSLSIYGSNSSIKGLPDSIGNLKKLTHLHLYDIHTLEYIPNSIQQLEQLKSFNIVGHSIPRSRQKEIQELLPNCLVRF